MTREQFKADLKRLLRQLAERQRAVELKQKKEQFYLNKLEEYRAFIRRIFFYPWFEAPKPGSRLWKIYTDIWDHIPEDGGRHTDPRLIGCRMCGWVGMRMDAFHTYKKAFDPCDVEPIDKCPKCHEEI